jgi:hypothetical protein
MELLPTQSDAERAWKEWGASCGPTALAACFQVDLNKVRPAMAAVGYEKRPLTGRWTSPTMMLQALESLGARVVLDKRKDGAFPELGDDWPGRGLVRVQWTGPWTADGANPRWAHYATHWVASLRHADRLLVFDVNCGWGTFTHWVAQVVPLLTRNVRRADGGWYASHLWTVQVPTAQRGLTQENT